MIDENIPVRGSDTTVVEDYNYKIPNKINATSRIFQKIHRKLSLDINPDWANLLLIYKHLRISQNTTNQSNSNKILATGFWTLLSLAVLFRMIRRKSWANYFEQQCKRINSILWIRKQSLHMQNVSEIKSHCSQKCCVVQSHCL